MLVTYDNENNIIWIKYDTNKSNCVFCDVCFYTRMTNDSLFFIFILNIYKKKPAELW